MSSIPAPPELLPPLPALKPPPLAARVKRSMALQIVLAITSISILLVAGSCWMVSRLLAEKLEEISEPMMFGNLAFLQQDLATAEFASDASLRPLVNRRASRVGHLDVALLDAQRERIVASDHFVVPLSALPARPWPYEDLLQSRGRDPERPGADSEGPEGPFTELWTAPDGRSYRLLFASIPTPPAAVAQYGAHMLAVLALDLSPTRAFVRKAWRILYVTLGVGALAAMALAWWMARRILEGTTRLGSTANRISAQALHERLSLSQSPAELEAVATAFNRMLDRLEDAFKRLSEFSSDLAHDLRAPIHNLLMSAQITLSKPRSADEYRELIEASVDQYERIARLIDNILFLARADHAQTATRRSWIELAPKLQGVAEFFELLADENGLALDFQVQGIDGTTPSTWADDTMLNRAVGNLLTNALRHAAPGTRVLLSAKVHAGGGSTIEVANEGAPIAAAHQADIFQRRYRIEDPLAHAEPGSGLGLAIVKSIMDLHGGTASVRSAPGQATVFSLWFPPPAAAVRAG